LCAAASNEGCSDLCKQSQNKQKTLNNPAEFQAKFHTYDFWEDITLWKNFSRKNGLPTCKKGKEDINIEFCKVGGSELLQ
jgi:hypothetical protein